MRLLAACCLATTLAAATVAEQVGINIHFSDPKPGELEQLVAVGAGWVRRDLTWAATEKEPGVYDFAAHERLLAALDRHGIKAVLILAYGNTLYDEGGPPRSAAGRRAFAAWAAAAAAKLKGHGVRWEIWNEPNSRTFWKPAPDAAAYAALAREAAAAIRAAAPDEVVVGPATSRIDMGFIESVCAAGLLADLGGFTVHPYRETTGPETAAAEYRRLRTLFRCWAPPGRTVPVLSGEWGYADVWKGFDVQRQARYLARMWLANIAERIPLSIWYDWRDDGRSPTDPECHFGLVRWQHFPGAAEAYEPKPAYRAAQTLLRELGGFAFAKRLVLGGPEDHVLLFTRGAEVRIAAWTTRAAPTTQRLPMGAGPVRAVGLLGGVAELTAGGEGLELTVDEDVRYLTPPAGDPLLAIAAAWEAAPPEWVLPAGAPGAATLRLRNPLTRPIRILAGSGTAGGEVAPGAEHVWSQAVAPPWDGEPAPLRFVCAIEGLGTLAQEGAVVADAPLALAAGCGLEGIAVRLASPAGRAFAGSVELAGETRPIAIPAGSRSAAADFPGAVAGPQTVRLRDAAGAVVLERRLDPLPAGAASWRAVADGDPKTAAEVQLAPAGSGLRVDYAVAPGPRFVRILPAGGPIAFPGHPRILTLRMKGAGATPRLMLRFRDAAGQTFQPDARRLAGEPGGWQVLEFRLDGVDTWRWGGPDDGVVHGAIQLDTLLGIDPSPAGGSGSVEIAAAAVAW